MHSDGNTTARLAVLALHVLALLLWIGALVSITRVVASAERQPDEVRAALASVARRIYRAVASTWMGVAVLTGVQLTLTYPQNWQARAHSLSGPRWLFQQPFWHAKLTAVVLLLALHFLLGARVRRVERGNDAAGVAGPMRGIQLGVLLLAALVVSCVLVWKRATVAPTPPRRTTVVTVPLGPP